MSASVAQPLVEAADAIAAATSVAATNAWRKHSFYIEMKPRGDYASLFIDCPTDEADDNTTTTAKGSIDAEFVRVGNNSLEVVEDVGCGNVSPNSATAARRTKYVASFVDLALVPNSVCALSWADRRCHLFMCKVRAEMEEGLPCLRKSFHSFEEELRQRLPIRECIDEIGESGGLRIFCRQCQADLYSHSNSECEFEALPDDDWLDTSPSLEYFCGQACGGGHGLERHCHLTSHHLHDGILGISTSGMTQSASKWLPNAQKIVFTNSFLMFLENETLQSSLEWNEGSRILTCAECQSQVGMTLRNNKAIYKLHVGAIEVYGGKYAYPQAKDYIFSRFQSLERYFAWMFLYKSESQSSMKLLIRTYQQKPFMLVWLLEPYVIMANGVLKRQESTDSGIESDENHSTLSSVDNGKNTGDYEHQSFPALKILYKIYDEESAASDPRANGGDSSVGIADLPYGCGLQLAEILLQSTHSLPPSLRAVGQLYVGYFRLDERPE